MTRNDEVTRDRDGADGGVPHGHGVSRPDACSVLSELASASAYGTAAGATFWVALEQNGPWGRHAATESHLAPGLGGWLERGCADRGGRLILIRRPDAHPDRHSGTPRCYVAWAGVGSFLLSADLDAPEDLLALDLEALSRGDRDGVIASVPSLTPTAPVLLVCTNARRDVCCAVRGRPVALADNTAYPGRVWECSHTGGHRFAPTGVLLPWGRTLARLDEPSARDLLAAADLQRLPTGLLGPRHDRGWSALSPDAQAAESAVRAQIGERDLTALTVSAPPAPIGDASVAGERLTVSHADGRTWSVAVSRLAGADRPESCGKRAVTSWTWTAIIDGERGTSGHD